MCKSQLRQWVVNCYLFVIPIPCASWYPLPVDTEMSCKRKKLESLAAYPEWGQQGWRSRLEPSCLCSQGITKPGCREGNPWGEAGPAPAAPVPRARRWKSPRLGQNCATRRLLQSLLLSPSALCCHRADNSVLFGSHFVWLTFVLLKLIPLSTWMPWQNRESLFLG